MNNTTKVGLGLLGAGLLLTIAGAIENHSEEEEDFLSDDDCCSCPPICEPPDHIEPPFFRPFPENMENLTLVPTELKELPLMKPNRIILVKR